MKKFLRWTIAILGLLLLLAIALLLSLDPIVKKVAEHRIRKQTGLVTRIGQLTCHFSPASLSLKNFKIYNQPQFGGAVLLDIPEWTMELDNAQALAGKLRFKNIRFVMNEFNIVRGKDGRLNLEALAATNSVAQNPSQGSGRERGLEFAGIEKMCLSLGKVSYTDLQQPSRNQAIDLAIRDEVFENIATEADLKRWSGAFGVRLLLQIVTQQMLNSPERAQGFGNMLNEIKTGLLKSSP